MKWSTAAWVVGARCCGGGGDSGVFGNRTCTIPDTTPGIKPYLISTGSIPGVVLEGVKSGIIRYGSILGGYF